MFNVMLIVLLIIHALFSIVTVTCSAQLVCPSKHEACTNTQTCCSITSQKHGCCPATQATCCSDHAHCCPRDFVCNIKENTCTRADSSIRLLSLKPAQGLDQLTKQTTSNKNILATNCPDGKTRCRKGHSGFGCCVHTNGICCSDNLHCCPNGLTCDLTQKKCVKPNGAAAVFGLILDTPLPTSTSVPSSATNKSETPGSSMRTPSQPPSSRSSDKKPGSSSKPTASAAVNGDQTSTNQKQQFDNSEGSAQGDHELKERKTQPQQVNEKEAEKTGFFSNVLSAVTTKFNEVKQKMTKTESLKPHTTSKPSAPQTKPLQSKQTNPQLNLPQSKPPPVQSKQSKQPPVQSKHSKPLATQSKTQPILPPSQSKTLSKPTPVQSKTQSKQPVIQSKPTKTPQPKPVTKTLTHPNNPAAQQSQHHLQQLKQQQPHPGKQEMKQSKVKVELKQTKLPVKSSSKPEAKQSVPQSSKTVHSSQNKLQKPPPTKQERKPTLPGTSATKKSPSLEDSLQDKKARQQSSTSRSVPSQSAQQHKVTTKPPSQGEADKDDEKGFFSGVLSTVKSKLFSAKNKRCCK